jgi:hypothetical protein
MKYEQEQATTSIKPHLHTAPAGAGLPILQAFIIGVLVWGMMMAAAMYWQWLDPWFWPLIVGLASTLLAYLYLLRVWTYLVTRVETWKGVDLNGDGVVGPVDKEEVVRPVRIDMQEFRNGQPVQTVRARFANHDKMVKLAEHLIRYNRPFSEPALCGRGKILLPSEFVEIKAEMIARGMLIARNPHEPRQGYELTRAGKAAMNDMLQR